MGGVEPRVQGGGSEKFVKVTRDGSWELGEVLIMEGGHQNS